MPVKLSKLVGKKSGAESSSPTSYQDTFRKIQKNIPSAFVTLMQAVEGLRTVAFEVGQSDVYKEIQDLDREVSTMYKRLEALQQKIQKAIK